MSSGEKLILSFAPHKSAPAIHDVQSQPALAAPNEPHWRRLAVPGILLLVAIALATTLTFDLNAWEVGHLRQDLGVQGQ
jgi:hypothetical protein